MSQMSQITLYSTTICPFCVRAKMLFEKKEVDFEEINLDQQPERREEMLARSGGRRTVPQIFIGEHHVGGCDDLYLLESEGKLDALLADL